MVIPGEVKHLSVVNVRTCYKQIIINGMKVIMEIDTGSCVNLMSSTKFKSISNHPDLKEGHIELQVANGQFLATLDSVRLD